MLQISGGILLLGAVRGLLIGLAGVGLVLVFRGSRVLNLAAGQLGAVAAAVLGRLVVDHGFPYFLALPIALLLGVALGVVVDLGVIARLRDSPRVIVTVATVALSELFLVVASNLPQLKHNLVFPTGLSVSLSDSLRFKGPEVMVLAAVPAAVVALALFLRLTPTGLALRAVRQNQEAATLAGISPRRVSATVWGIAGGIAALTAVLTQGIDRTLVGAGDTGFAGSALLLSSFVAALAGGLRSLPWTLVGGLLVGEFVDVLQFSHYSPDDVKLGLLAATLVLVTVIALVEVLRGRSADPDAAVSLTGGRLHRLVGRADRRSARRVGLLGTASAFVAAALVPAFDASAGTLSLATRAVLFAMLGLSLTLLTSWAGQLSLGQIAIYAFAAVVAAKLVSLGAPFPVALAAAAAVGAASSLLVAVPALLAQGISLALVTLALSIAAPDNVFRIPGLRDVEGLSITRPGFAATTSHYYLFCLALLAVVTAGVVHLRRTGIARRIIAARSNPRRAASLTIDGIEARLVAFALSGAVAGLAGGLFAGLQRQLSPLQFPAVDSLTVVAVVAIGGFSSSIGPLLGAAFVVGIPAAFGNSITADALTAGLGLLAVLLYLPGGLASLAVTLRDTGLAMLFRQPVNAAAGPTSRGRAPTPGVPTPRGPLRLTGLPAPSGVPPLRVSGVSFSVGSRSILESIAFEVGGGEILGVIGANGAGKSSLLAVIAGESRPSAGRIEIAGRDATAASAEVHAAAGVGRMFQDAMLFGDLTTAETVSVALETVERSALPGSVLGLPAARGAERAKRAATQEVLALLGLAGYSDYPVSRLSTGTRRIVELAVIVAQGATLLLLDEPTAGLAQREVEAFGPLLLTIKEQLAATIVIVEHDVPLVSAVSDRLLCLGDGRVLAVGEPATVLADPAVLVSYLGQQPPAGQVRVVSRGRVAPVGR